MIEQRGEVVAVQQEVVGTRFGLSVGVAQVEVYSSAAAQAAVLEAEQATRIAAGLSPAGATLRPTRLSELLVTPDTGRARVHAVLRDVAEAQAQLHALRAAAIARLAELQPAQQQLPGARADDPADPDRPDDWVADEVAVVLGISVGSASSLVQKQRALVEQLPQVWTALADGVIDVRRAQVLIDALADRKRSAGGGLADDLVDTIADHGLGWIAEGIGPTPLADRIGGALIAADPAEADRRAERRKRRQNVTSVGQGDGLASLRTDLADAADVAEEIDVIDALAATMRRGGDKRPMGQLRIAAHHHLITRPWEVLPPEVAAARWHLTLRADLADLDDLGPLLDPPADHPPTNTDTDTANPDTEPVSAPADGEGRGDNRRGPAGGHGDPIGHHDTSSDAADANTVTTATGGTGATGVDDAADPTGAATVDDATDAATADDAPDPTDPTGAATEDDATDAATADDAPDPTDPTGAATGDDATDAATADDAPDPTDEATVNDPTGTTGTTDHDASAADATTGTAEAPDATRDRAAAGSGVGSIGGLPVSPVAVAELLARYEALMRTGRAGRVDGGEVWFEIVDATGRLQALTSPAEARAAVRRGTGLGPPPAIDGYEPTAAQIRFVTARDRHCRFPGCHRPAEYADLDHVIPHNHHHPTAGGPTCVTNLVCLCRRHHRLKTHAPGWVFAMDPDGTLHVTPPGGRTRTTRPAGIAEIDMSTRSQRDSLIDLLGRTPKRFRTPNPEERAQRRATSADRARIAAEIEAELNAALARQAAGQVDGHGDPVTEDPPPF